jgi:hypothetical protein
VADSQDDALRDLAALEADLKRLEAEYNMFFAGRLPRPPWETRTRVADLVKRLDRQHLPNYAVRFRFSTLQARFSTFVDLWDRGLRAREEGRSGPFAQTAASGPATPNRSPDRVLQVTTLRDPLQEAEKLHELYHGVAEARREVGLEAIPFDRFADLIATQVRKLREQGSQEVAFCVAVKDGKVAFTARAHTRAR